MTPFGKTLAAALALVAGLQAEPAQAIVSTGDLCATETARTERTRNIPQHLLTAISLAETGRWRDDKGEIVAWPWTVTNGGPGRYFPTKRAAVAEVRRLMAAGETNIDVGCMQINLRHHGDNFVSIEHAFDPAANVAYGAGFLQRLFKEAKSWTKAASWYHSRTPHLAKKYLAKVNRLWGERQRNAEPVRIVERAPEETSRVRFARLSDRYRAHQAKTAGVRDLPADQATTRRKQLDSWRNGDSAGVAALAQRLRKEQAEKRKYSATRNGVDKAKFAKKRRSQLQAWRLGRAYASGGAGS